MFDEDKAFDEIVGSMYFSLKDLVKKGEKPGGFFYWQNLYGAPKGYSGANVDIRSDLSEATLREYIPTYIYSESNV